MATSNSYYPPTTHMSQYHYSNSHSTFSRQQSRTEPIQSTSSAPGPSREGYHTQPLSLPTNSGAQATRSTRRDRCSVATLENARYHPDDIPYSEHPNEDRHFMLKEDNFTAVGVFDGHDGPRAAGFASNYFVQYFNTDSWQSLARAPPQQQRETIPIALKEFFKAAEKEFFNSIRSVIEEKNTLQAIIPRGMKSYQAYLTYPVEVARLQELEPRIAGGTTVVLAVICNNTLYVANTGDSRAILVNENSRGIQQIVQLSVDHGVENIDELRRLVLLGLDRNQLERSGRLGSQENTRSIGDYYIKEGYKDVDTLQHCREQPGLSEPHVDVIPLTPHCKHLILMTDGVYKSIEATFEQKAAIESNKVLMSMVNHELESIRSFEVISDRTLDRIRKVHEDTFAAHARRDVRSPMAVSCRKRDDMTLLIYQFDNQTSSYV